MNNGKPIWWGEGFDHTEEASRLITPDLSDPKPTLSPHATVSTSLFFQWGPPSILHIPSHLMASMAITVLGAAGQGWLGCPPTPESARRLA